MHEKDKAVIPVAITGALSSIVFCAFKAFFSFSYRTPRAGFFVNYAYILLAYTLIPVAAVYLIFLVFSKDDDAFLAKSYFPLLCAFFSVYVPYTVLAGSRSAYSAFELFCKPVLYTAMLASSAVCVFFLYRAGGAAGWPPPTPPGRGSPRSGPTVPVRSLTLCRTVQCAGPCAVYAVRR